MRRTSRCAATTKLKRNAADGLFTRPSQLGRHLLDDIGFDDVIDLIIPEIPQGNPALESGLDLAHVILHPLQGADGGFVNHLPAPHQMSVGSADNLPLQNRASGHHADPGDIEDLTDLGAPRQLFLVDRIEEPLHGFANVIDGVVDDVVKPDIDLLLLRQGLGFRFGLDVEPEDDGLGGRSQHAVGLIDRPHRTVQEIDVDGVGAEAGQGLGHGLHGSLDIRLQDQVQVLDHALLHLFVKVFQGDL